MKKSVEVRSDHLLAIIDYAYQQMVDSDIPVLDVGDNENDLNIDEQLEYVQELLHSMRMLTFDGHRDLVIKHK